MKEFDINNLNELVDLAINVARNTLDEYIIVAKRVVELAFRRQLHNKLTGFLNDCSNDAFTLGDLNKRVYDGITQVGKEFITTENIELFGKKIDGIVKDIKSRQSSDGIYGIPSKFPALNEYFQYEKTELVVVQGMRKKGKSVMMMNECAHKIKNGCPTLYVDTELSDRNFTERFISHLSGVPVKKLKQGTYTQSEEALIDDAINFIKKSPLVHIYNPSLTMDELYTICKILKYKIGLQFVIYDYLKSAELDSSSQYNDLGRKTDALKNTIGGSLELAVLAGCQLNRQGSVADSFKIEQYLSTAVMIDEKSREEIERDGQECGNYKLSVRLNRNGEQMAEDEYIDVLFNFNTVTMEQAKKQHEKSDLPI